MPANYVLIGEQTVSVPVASVTFSNIPQTGYTDLKIVGSPRTATGGGQAQVVLVRFNGDSATNYRFRALEAFSGSNVQSYGEISQTRGLLGGSTTSDTEANTFGNCEIYIPNYRSSTQKSFSADAWADYNSASLGAGGLYANIYSGTSAITSITLFSNANWAQNTSFSLYGIAALGTTPTVVPKASGGDIVVNDGTYWYHAFLSSGIFAPSSNLSCDYLVVAGGGGGGVTGGAGGAGGYRTTTGTSGRNSSPESPLSLVAQNYAITIGAGGAGGAGGGPNQIGINGSNTTFSTITSVGGGRGSADGNDLAGNGGSGGGTTAGGHVAGLGTANQGFDSTSVFRGGGAGASSTNSSHNGGSGFTPAFASTVGFPNGFAGGGGGSPDSGSNPAGTATNGGGAGATARTTNAAFAGTPNTGGGGGGSSGVSGVSYGGAGGTGGSGIVIVRYTMA